MDTIVFTTDTARSESGEPTTARTGGLPSGQQAPLASCAVPVPRVSVAPTGGALIRFTVKQRFRNFLTNVSDEQDTCDPCPQTFRSSLVEDRRVIAAVVEVGMNA
jgi:hypothetical protein